jgi:hypothetical protein
MSTQPPRLALALLNRFVPDEEPLAGDLIEEFAAGRSRAWFWRQAIAAAALAVFRRSDEVRPLRLVDGAPARMPVPSTTTGAPRRTVNLTASPVAGIGGLSLVIFAAIMTIAMPQAWWIVLGAMLAGIVFGIVLIAVRRSRV